MLHIGRVGGLAHFPVADDIDPCRHLLGHDFGHGIFRLRFEDGGVNGPAFFLGQDQVEQQSWAGQTADMGG